MTKFVILLRYKPIIIDPTRQPQQQEQTSEEDLIKELELLPPIPKHTPGKQVLLSKAELWIKNIHQHTFTLKH